MRIDTTEVLLKYGYPMERRVIKVYLSGFSVIARYFNRVYLKGNKKLQCVLIIDGFKRIRISDSDAFLLAPLEPYNSLNGFFIGLVLVSNMYSRSTNELDHIWNAWGRQQCLEGPTDQLLYYISHRCLHHIFTIVVGRTYLQKEGQ